MLDPSLDIELSSGVDILRPRLLGFFLGGFGGTMNEGVGGAEKAWVLAVVDVFG